MAAHGSGRLRAWWQGPGRQALAVSLVALAALLTLWWQASAWYRTRLIAHRRDQEAVRQGRAGLLERLGGAACHIVEHRLARAILGWAHDVGERRAVGRPRRPPDRAAGDNPFVTTIRPHQPERTVGTYECDLPRHGSNRGLGRGGWCSRPRQKAPDEPPGRPRLPVATCRAMPNRAPSSPPTVRW